MNPILRFQLYQTLCFILLNQYVSKKALYTSFELPTWAGRNIDIPLASNLDGG